MIYSKQSADAVLAYLDAFIKNSSEVVFETVENMQLGSERAFMTIAPEIIPELTLTPEYNNLINRYLAANRELILTENKRMFLSIVLITRNQNIIVSLIQKTIEAALSAIPLESQEVILEHVKKYAINKGKSVIANQSVKIATTIALTELISSILINKLSTSSIITGKIKTLTSATLTGLQIYAIIEKASRSARKLRRENAEIYNQLHKENMEMLYFLIEGKVKGLLISIKEKSKEKISQFLVKTLEMEF